MKGWIKFSDRPPTSEDAYNGFVLAYSPKHDDIDTASISYLYEFHHEYTHWRPLPAPPKNEEDQSMEKAKFRIKLGVLHYVTFILALALFWDEDEKFVSIAFGRWSVSIGLMWEDSVI
jgi:hypothetical protein